MTTPFRAVAFVVPGEPATQGSTKAFVVRRKSGKLGAAVVHDNAKTLPWRGIARAHALAVFHGKPWDFPVRVIATFAVTKPKSRPKRDTLADRKPDLDKLCRALGDALEGTVITQDSRIVEWQARKVFDGEPRTEVRVEALG